MEKTFAECVKNGSNVGLKKLTSGESIKEVCKMKFPKLCTKYDLFCSYAEKKCTLVEEGGTCTETLRSVMGRKYNHDNKL